MSDSILAAVFGVLSLLGLATGGLSFRMAMKHARKQEHELRMAGWAVLGLAGLVLAGMSWAYFLIPIILHRLF